jgi:antigen flippase
MTKQNNHHAIFRASFLTGGAQVVGLVVGLVRNKVIALCLGAPGLGFSAMLNQVYGIMQSASTLGIPAAGVRSVALAREDERAMALSVRAVRYVCVLLSTIVAIAFAIASPLVSYGLFGDYHHAVDLLVVIIGLIFAQMAASEQIILRGVGRVGILAKINVVASATGAFIAIPLVYFVGQRGIAPSILLSSLALYLFSRRASQSVIVHTDEHSREEVARKAWALARIGAAFFGLTIIGMLLSLSLSIMIQRHEGIAGNGIYQAAVALTVTIASFVLSAMGQDFYPKVIHLLGKGQKEDMSRYCANQIEMGLLMALPVLAAASGFSHELILAAFSQDFHAADPVVGILAASCWARICYWPHMLCMLAEADATKILTSELGFALTTFGLAWILLPVFGVIGVACAYAVCFLIYSVFVSVIVKRITGHLPLGDHWLLYIVGLLCIIGAYYLHPLLRICLLLALTVFVIRRLMASLGTAHRLTKLVSTIPFLRCLAPKNQS